MQVFIASCVLVSMEKLTRFQTWVLFMTFDKGDDEWMSSKTLLKECCESSLKELDSSNTDKELEELCEKGYLELEPQPKPFLIPFESRTQTQPKYGISNTGIVYVRKAHSRLQNTKGPRVEKYLNNVSTHFPKFEEEVRNKTLDIQTMISVGLKDISVILQLLEIVVG